MVGTKRFTIYAGRVRPRTRVATGTLPNPVFRLNQKPELHENRHCQPHVSPGQLAPMGVKSRVG